MDDVHVVTSPGLNNSSQDISSSNETKSKRKPLIILRIVLAFISVFVVILVFFPNLIIKDPKLLISNAFGKLSKSDSVSFESQFYGLDDFGKLTLSGTINQNSQLYSKIKLDFTTTDTDELQQTVILDLIFNNQEVYIKPFISSFSLLESEILQEAPEIAQSESYKILRPIVAGEKWILFKNSGDSSEAASLLKEKYKNLIKGEDIQKLAQKFAEAVTIKSFDKNAEQNGLKVYRIVAGLEKAKLTEFVNEVDKVIRNDITRSYSKEIKGAIDAVNWDQNLFEIVIDKKTGNLYSIDINLPDLGKISTTSSLKNTEPPNLFFRALTDEYYRAQLEKELRANQNIPLVRIVTVSFKDFGKATLVSVPDNFSDWEDIWNVIEKELGNYLDSIGGILGAINPSKQFAEERDTQRRADLSAISNAIYQFAAEHGGNLPDTDNNNSTSDFPTSPTCIGTSPTCFNLSAAGTVDTIVPVYIAQLPYDPLNGSLENSNYTIYLNQATGRIVISAKGEVTPDITVTR
ncbi:hypothetical protein A3D84_05460 [Candidatus Woesebacteria bacterium RIFCSPHIGHO2_02_FULL_42_20]|nr:MAG: hypothetical protein A2873_04525 [Candidatus Woesebacteria bacterium RIFCSPHIGHO2_01_FULL_42_80]OGM35491.1 MAG: hypothetical protein A3D84_05460 [Candidatus Woesebacteria bacterium RIFCSPHIGHO2_02_FULL_42_20]OGM65882.1 MAG: hypothetical protein A2969_05675 [Candidatus Woesebacteria bacterium RIFCSPLOWO2_01_FULL_42_67]OGM70547.1 MAG: hypothetical protein A3I55_02145 [Candidatus Woesebacteria bacterium RIFCSPLOWO2_02_FULL_42_10]OGM74351.1 MAG: hypothetical protein A3H21_02250 [Candidatus 